MATRRRRKHPSVDVSGHIPVQDQPAGWEVDLMIEAFARLRSPRTDGSNQASATMTERESNHAAL